MKVGKIFCRISVRYLRTVNRQKVYKKVKKGDNLKLATRNNIWIFEFFFFVFAVLSTNVKNVLVLTAFQGLTGEEVSESFKKYFGAEGHAYVKCYFPTAPERYLTIRDTKQRYWFDAIRNGKAQDDVTCSIRDAEDVTDMIEKLIEEIEQSGISRERIIIGGASQGGMVSIYAAYARGIRVGGVVGIAATFPFYKNSALLHGCTTPLLSIYGQKDAFIMPSMMDKAWQLFRYKKIPLTVKTFKHLGHDMDMEYAKTLFEWITQKYPQNY